MSLTFKRIIKLGWEKFVRDKSSSGAMILVTMVLILTLTFLFFLGGISRFLVQNIQNSVDVSAYFKDDALEQDILNIQTELLSMPEVKSADYVSKDDALKQFTNLHKNDQEILDSLQALGTNPFLASLHIKVKDPGKYQKIAEFLGQASFEEVIQKVDYNDRAPIIEKVGKLTFAIQKGFLGLSIVLALIALLVAFNTVRLTIYSSKEEIEIMRLVGAANSFIEGPFLVQGIVVGLISAATIFVLLLLLVLVFSPKLGLFLSGFSLSHYLFSNLWIIIVLQLGTGVLLGVFSSMIAIRKYLKV